ncbi:hypothetical protein NP233_g3569 [Leucocoprinus birnbaumii]|uniref:Nephrocystin 3-like N-terminal domain-containing protein n=1 Tax=Leucocoprinus birnbaumii TaxID=56174 RepID=A0AAD5VW99_9AGAR|nr:hypothetical protein NP233_g3569 [Leucocoprinus birnbaumii]
MPHGARGFRDRISRFLDKFFDSSRRSRQDGFRNGDSFPPPHQLSSIHPQEQQAPLVDHKNSDIPPFLHQSSNNPRARPLPPLPATASSSQVPEGGFFRQAHNFSIHNSQFIDNSHATSGLELLYKSSMPHAFHDAGARYPPPKCHLGTRNNYITYITNWAIGESAQKEPILWMYGPFGVGKTAVAQSSAEALTHCHKLTASLFFSRSNADRDDPQRVFPSIAYQIATKFPPFKEILETRIRSDPALLTKSLSMQFEELLVLPLRQLGFGRREVEGLVVVLDGLDECRGSANQCEIVNIIATSARNRTTPLRWFITSRPEDPIIQTMNSDNVHPVSIHLKLPVSRSIDHEILIYLTDEFERIRERHHIPHSWPSDEVLALLVERTAGLWIYASTIIRFIEDQNSYGPKDQLRIVLKFAKDVPTKVGPDNPLAEMDFFYKLIITRIPPKIRTTVRKILLIDHINKVPDFSQYLAEEFPIILGLDDEQYRHSCTFMQSVMYFGEHGLLRFYHASFLDFMIDPKRSKELCILGAFLNDYRNELLDWLHEVCSRSIDSSHIVLPSSTTLPEDPESAHRYRCVLSLFFELCGTPEHPISHETASSLSRLPFKQILGMLSHPKAAQFSNCQQFRENLPAEFRDQIIRLGPCPSPGCRNKDDVWILGHGVNETATEKYIGDNQIWLIDNQGWPERDTGKLQEVSNLGALFDSGNPSMHYRWRNEFSQHRKRAPNDQLHSSSHDASESPQKLRFQTYGAFQQAHDFVMINPQFVEASLNTGLGLEILLRNSMPDTFHDSGARYPPPRCHSGTRNDYIDRITNWALGGSHRERPILWMHGPFGAGKTAIAQSSADILQLQGKLAASIFFSRSSSECDDPRRVFTSIAYQIATKLPFFGDILDRRLRSNPAIAMKSLSMQFQELLVLPLRQFASAAGRIPELVVVLDGLDECRGRINRFEMINIIAASARDQSTPLLWFITSRPDDAIVQTMGSDRLLAVSLHLELPVSRDKDHEILSYLTSEFKRISKFHHFPDPWPSAEILASLVGYTAGLWVYAASTIRFIDDENSFGPKDQLRITLDFAEGVSAKAGSNSPLAEMDFLYTLILSLIPSTIRTTVRKILLIHSVLSEPWSEKIIAILHLSDEQFHRCCASIQSVARLEETGLHFYHASFLDFMRDPERSKEFCIFDGFLIEYRWELLEWLHKSLQLPFKKMLSILPDVLGEPVHCIGIRDNLPAQFRDKIIRWERCPAPGCKNTELRWILGHGDNTTATNEFNEQAFWLINNQDSPEEMQTCFCGALLGEN